MCVGIVINKLRGEVKYFEPGPAMLQEMVGKPIFVVSYLNKLNIAEEDTKFGLEFDEVSEIIEYVYDDNKAPNIRIVGLMAMATTAHHVEQRRGRTRQLDWRAQLIGAARESGYDRVLLFSSRDLCHTNDTRNRRARRVAPKLCRKRFDSRAITLLTNRSQHQQTYP